MSSSTSVIRMTVEPPGATVLSSISASPMFHWIIAEASATLPSTHSYDIVYSIHATRGLRVTPPVFPVHAFAGADCVSLA